MENDYTVLVDYPNDWSIVTDDSHSFVAVAYKGTPTYFLDVAVPDSDDNYFADILETLMAGTIVDTDYLTGYAVEMGEWDEWDGVYPVHVVYVLTDTEGTNVASADTLDAAVDALRSYTGESVATVTEDTADESE